MVGTLAATTLALLTGDEAAARAVNAGWSAAEKREAIRVALSAYDDCRSGVLSCDEATALFSDLARSIVEELAASPTASEVARMNARRILDNNDARGTIARVASKLLQLADQDQDGRVSLFELAGLFDTVQRSSSSSSSSSPSSSFPQPLRALAGSLQLLPPSEGTATDDARDRARGFHLGVPGDDHSLREVTLTTGAGTGEGAGQRGSVSIVGIGRSADASAYFLPALGIVFDAGIHVKSISPKCVLLTHGHRDHTAALPTMAQRGAAIYAPDVSHGSISSPLPSTLTLTLTLTLTPLNPTQLHFQTSNLKPHTSHLNPRAAHRAAGAALPLGRGAAELRGRGPDRPRNGGGARGAQLRGARREGRGTPPAAEGQLPGLAHAAGRGGVRGAAQEWGPRGEL